MCIIITTNVHYFGVIRMDQDNLRLIDRPSQTLADMSINCVIFKYKFGTKTRRNHQYQYLHAYHYPKQIINNATIVLVKQLESQKTWKKNLEVKEELIQILEIENPLFCFYTFYIYTHFTSSSHIFYLEVQLCFLGIYLICIYI